jgi:selenocysteine lyase/cysteine desulfurase
MTPRTRLVAVCHASNVLGVLQDAGALAGAAHEGGALLVLDASQSAGVIPIDVEAMGIDLLAFTGHKALLGPMGTGGLVVREGVPIGPWREGGTGGDSGSPTQPESFPHFLEGGTPNAVGLAGLGAGVRYVLDRGAAELGRHERAMARRLAQALAGVPRVRIHAAPGAEEDGGARPSRARAGAGAGAAGADDSPVGMARAASAIGLVTFTVAGYEPSEVAAILDQTFGIAMRAGMHCAPYIHRRLGLDPGGTVRASAGPFTTEQEIDEAAAAVAEIAAA